MPTSQETGFFGRNASVLLDLLRFAAALAVALTHMPHRIVSAEPLIPERSGNSAVCVFFVLSGFVIRYVTATRVSTGAAYAIDRVSRLYSVVLPALLLTLLLEGAAYLHAPAVYRVFSDPFPWGAVPAELLQTATFTVGWWNWGATPLSNGPFWSLSFECVYYALYGLIVYAPRARWVLVPLLLLAVGPAIALLFPVWLFGVVLYELYLRLSARRFGPGLAAAVLLAYAGVLFAFRRPILQFLQQTTVGERATALTAWVASYGWGRTMFHGATLHWLDRFSISYFLTGSVLVALMLPLLLALDRYLPQASRRVAGWIRMVADSTFTLYLLHLPLFIFVVTMLRAPLRGWREGLLLLAFAIVLSMGLAMLFDRLKNAMRAGLRRRSPAIAVRSS